MNSRVHCRGVQAYDLPPMRNEAPYGKGPARRAAGAKVGNEVAILRLATAGLPEQKVASDLSGGCLASKSEGLATARKVLPRHKTRSKARRRIRGMPADFIELPGNKEWTDKPNQVPRVEGPVYGSLWGRRLRNRRVAFLPIAPRIPRATEGRRVVPPGRHHSFERNSRPTAAPAPSVRGVQGHRMDSRLQCVGSHLRHVGRARGLRPDSDGTNADHRAIPMPRSSYKTRWND